MISPVKIHQWIIKALEEPYFRAEMHRVKISLPEGAENVLQLVKKDDKTGAVESAAKGMGKYAKA